jgi:hypothetical protein
VIAWTGLIENALDLSRYIIKWNEITSASKIAPKALDLLTSLPDFYASVKLQKETRVKNCIVVGLVLFMSCAIAKGQHEIEAERFLELSGAQATMNTMADMVLTQELKQNPALVPYEKVLVIFLKKHLSYEALKDEFISVYVKAFTKEELAAMNEFYSSKVGKKVVRLAPVLMRRGGDIGTKRVQDNMDELKEMIQQEADRLKTLNEE